MCGYEITGMRNRIQAIQSGCIHTNECKSSLCVAMGTRATLTKGEQKSKRHREEKKKKKTAWREEGEVGKDSRDKGGKERVGSDILIHSSSKMYHLLRDDPQV